MLKSSSTFVHIPCNPYPFIRPVPDMTYNLFGGTLSLTQSIKPYPFVVFIQMSFMDGLYLVLPGTSLSMLLLFGCSAILEKNYGQNVSELHSVLARSNGCVVAYTKTYAVCRTS